MILGITVLRPHISSFIAFFSPLYLPSTRPHRQNPVSFVLQTFLIVTTFNPDCGSILGNPQKEQPDPGGAEMV